MILKKEQKNGQEFNLNKMKKTVSILIILIIFISCKEKNGKKREYLQNFEKMNDLKNAPYNISELGDGLKFNYDTLSVEYINKVKNSLVNRNFKFLDNDQFQQRILKVFDFNIDDYENNIIVLRPAMFSEIVVKDQKFIIVEDSETDDSENINSDLEYYYNSFVIYNDKMSYNWLKLHQNEVLKDLVVEYGYNEDKELVKFVFDNFDFDSKTLFHDLIFKTDLKTSKLILRESIINDIEDIVYGGSTIGYMEAKEGKGYNTFSEIIEMLRKNSKQYLEPEKTIAFLYEKDLRVGIVGHVESNLTMDSKYKTFLKNNNYFGYLRLKDYVEKVFEDNSNSNDQMNIYKIQDSDGYVNLRSGNNTNSTVISKITTGSRIEVLDDNDNWWYVKTSDGKKGYVHKSKIISE